MCVRQHWEETKNTSHLDALEFITHLREFAKTNGYSTKKIRIRNKQEIMRQDHSKADAQVIWEDGPEDWTYSIEYKQIGTSYCTPENGKTVSFYNLGTP